MTETNRDSRNLAQELSAPSFSGISSPFRCPKSLNSEAYHDGAEELDFNMSFVRIAPFWGAKIHWSFSAEKCWSSYPTRLAPE